MLGVNKLSFFIVEFIVITLRPSVVTSSHFLKRDYTQVLKLAERRYGLSLKVLWITELIVKQLKYLSFQL